MRRSVVLPEPDGPRSASNVPPGTSRLTLSRARKRSNRFVTFVMRMDTTPPPAPGGSSWTRERQARERAADQADVALRDPKRVPDVAEAVAVDVADLGVSERCLPALANPDIELGHDERV